MLFANYLNLTSIVKELDFLCFVVIGIKLKVIKELIDLIMLKQAVKHLLQNSDGGKIAQVSN